MIILLNYMYTTYLYRVITFRRQTDVIVCGDVLTAATVSLNVNI